MRSLLARCLLIPLAAVFGARTAPAVGGEPRLVFAHDMMCWIERAMRAGTLRLGRAAP